jgi:signal peptidase I
MPVSLEELHAPSMLERMSSAGITDTFLINKLKNELNAKITKTIKVKGAITASELPTNGKKKSPYRIVATSGQIITLRGKDGVEEDYGDGETIIAWEEIDWSTRQAAREDAHRLRNDYPAKTHRLEHTGKNGGPIEYSRLDRANRIVAIANEAKKSKQKDKKK